MNNYLEKKPNVIFKSIPRGLLLIENMVTYTCLRILFILM